MLAQHAAKRSAVAVHRDLARGLFGLGTVAATAPFLGMAGTVLGIFNSFPGCGGEKSACMAAVVERLSESMMPGAFGLALAITALWGYRYLDSRLDDFDAEMQNAILELTNRLAHHCRPQSP